MDDFTDIIRVWQYKDEAPEVVIDCRYSPYSDGQTIALNEEQAMRFAFTLMQAVQQLRGGGNVADVYYGEFGRLFMSARHRKEFLSAGGELFQWSPITARDAA